MYMYMYMHMYMYMYMYMHRYMYVFFFMYMYMYMHMSLPLSLYMCIYIYIYIHTYIYTCIGYSMISTEHFPTLIFWLVGIHPLSHLLNNSTKHFPTLIFLCVLLLHLVGFHPQNRNLTSVWSQKQTILVEKLTLEPRTPLRRTPHESGQFHTMLFRTTVLQIVRVKLLFEFPFRGLTPCEQDRP